VKSIVELPLLRSINVRNINISVEKPTFVNRILLSFEEGDSEIVASPDKSAIRPPENKSNEGNHLA
jgi:hypothetical protein